MASSLLMSNRLGSLVFGRSLLAMTSPGVSAVRTKYTRRTVFEQGGPKCRGIELLRDPTFNKVWFYVYHLQELIIEYLQTFVSFFLSQFEAKFALQESTVMFFMISAIRFPTPFHLDFYYLNFQMTLFFFTFVPRARLSPWRNDNSSESTAFSLPSCSANRSRSSASSPTSAGVRPTSTGTSTFPDSRTGTRSSSIRFDLQSL